MSKEKFVLTKQQQQLVEENHNLIYKYMSLYKLNMDDYYDILAIALCRAAKFYDSSKGSFSTLAFVCFNEECHKEYISQNTYKRMINNNVLSLEYEYQVDGHEDSSDVTLKDSIADVFDLEKSIEDKLTIESIKKILATIKPKERYVFIELLKGRTLQDVGNEFGLTRERIRQVRNKVIKELKTKVNSRTYNI